MKRRHPARLATLIVGSVIAVAGIVIVAVLGLVSVSYAQPGRPMAIPDTATAIEIEVAQSSVFVMSGGTQSATAALTGITSSLGGAIPRVEITMRGTTAVITIADERAPNYTAPWREDVQGLQVHLPGSHRYDSVTVRAQSAVTMQNVNAAALDVKSDGGDAIISTGSPAPDRVTVQSYGAVVSVLDDGMPWDVLTAAWFKTFPSADPSLCNRPNPDPYSSCNTAQSFGIYLGPTAGASHVIDLTQVPEGAFIHVGHTVGG